jgi:hypothetical protein
MENLQILKTVKVTSGDGVPLIYFPKEIVIKFGIRKGNKILILTDGKQLILQKIANGDKDE